MNEAPLSEATGQLILEELRKLTAPPARTKVPEYPMTPEELAKAIGKTAQTVRRWIKEGRLRARRDCRPWLITPVEVAKLLNPRQEAGV